MTSKKIKILIYMFLLPVFVGLFTFIPVRSDPIYTTRENLPYTSDYYDESPGVKIPGAIDDIFVICRDTLYFYNSTNNGTLYKVYLNQQPFTPLVVRGHLGDVRDIDASYGPNGDLIFLATAEYNNGIMKLNTSTLVYQKIISSQFIPQKLSVSYDYRFSSMFITWRTASNVFYWDTVDYTIYNIGPNFYSVIDVQYSEIYVMYYNSTEIRLYSTLSDSITHYIWDDGITSAFLDTSRGYIIYAQDDDYDTTPDGRIIQFDYIHSIFTNIELNVDYPVSVWCTPNYVFWIERGYWSGRSMIHRYSYYYDSPDIHYYSKVSRAHGVSWADRIEFQSEQYSNQHVLGVYWGYQQLYIINGSDITPPDKIEWDTNNNTFTYDHWSITWRNSYDLNDIDEYELQVSNTINFSIYNTCMILESELSYTSHSFTDMDYGVYYYRIRASDMMEQPNLSEWSEILQISYSPPAPDTGNPFAIPGYQFLVLFLSSFAMIGLIIVKKFKK